jgi:hypothetical protein
LPPQADASHVHDSFCLAFPQPLFFVASQNHVRVYNLVKQQLVRKLLGGAGRFTSLALHPTGDHVLTGTGSILSAPCLHAPARCGHSSCIRRVPNTVSCCGGLRHDRQC